MRVSRIEIFGFKSFMERLVLPLEGGITGVVGPNGCGKSNVVDAIRWVLGETNAKNLRGGVLEDVIFNGTEELRPLGLAEVTISLRANSGEMIDELVSPALEAELVAEKAVAEMDSIREAEATGDGDDTAEGGAPKLTVIDGTLEEGEESGQGEEAEDSSADKPAESEEESPINSPTLLRSLTWLKSVNEVQVTRRLYRSGESEFFINRVQCRLKDVKELFRAVGISARAYTIVAQGEVSRIISAKPEERRTIIEEAAGVLGFRDKISAAKRRLQDTSINLSRIEDIIKEVTRQTNSLRRQAAKARNRKSLKEEIKEFDQQLYRDRFLELSEKSKILGDKEQGLKSAEEVAQTNLKRAQAEENESRSELMRVDVEADGVRSKIDSIREEINNRIRRQAELTSRMSELGAYMVSSEEELREVAERISVLGERRQESDAEVARLEQEVATVASEMQTVSTVSVDEGELRGALSGLESARESFRQKNRELQSVHDKLVAATSSLEAVREQIDSATGCTKEFVDATAIIDGINIPEDLDRAVQAVLGDRSRFLVVADPYTVSESLSEEDQVGFVRGGEAGGVADIASVPFPRLLDRLTVSREVGRAAETLLGSVFVAPSREEATNWFNSQGDSAKSIRLVTAVGEVIEAESFSTLSGSVDLLELKRRADELDQRCQKFSSEEEVLRAERDEIEQGLRKQEEQHAEALRKSEEAQAEAREIGARVGSIRGRLESGKRLGQQIQKDISRLEEQRVQIKSKQVELQSNSDETRTALSSFAGGSEPQVEEELTGLTEESQRLEELRKSGREDLSKYADLVGAAREELDTARAGVSQLSLEVQKIEIELGNLKERVEEDYGEDGLARVQSDDFTEALTPGDRKELRELVSKLRTRLTREGEVDPTSIERYEEEKDRLDDLIKQAKDLEEAARTIKKTIERLTETSERRFLHTFKAVSENFTNLIPRLFGGGRGSIELLDPENPLESGIDIIARPPGKKLKRIELLSGGEKALCATALIFGMFMERPSPLCILDEVDAPLDDANLARFLTIVKEMCVRTQFILITHNKQSMSAVDRLVGVTMQQPGASKVLTVSLEEAYSHVA